MAHWNQHRIGTFTEDVEVRVGSYPRIHCSEVPPKQFKPKEPAYQDVHARHPQTSPTTTPLCLETPRDRKSTPCFDGDPRAHLQHHLIGEFCNHTCTNTNNFNLPFRPSRPLQYESEKDPPRMIRLATIHAGMRSHGARVTLQRRITVARARNTCWEREKEIPLYPKPQPS